MRQARDGGCLGVPLTVSPERHLVAVSTVVLLYLLRPSNWRASIQVGLGPEPLAAQRLAMAALEVVGASAGRPASCSSSAKHRPCDDRHSRRQVLTDCPENVVSRARRPLRVIEAWAAPH